MRKPFVISTQVFKGGAGKTSVASILITTLAEKGYRVLGIDTDPQKNLTSTFGLNANESHRNSYNFIMNANKEDFNPTSYLIETDYEYISFIPSSEGMSFIESELERELFNRESYMSTAIEKLSKEGLFDFIIIDAPTPIKVLNVNNYRASDYIIIPMECSGYNLDSLNQTYRFYMQNKQEKSDMDIGIVLNKVDHRESITGIIIESVQDLMKGHAHIFNTKLRIDTKIKVAQSMRMPVTVMDPTARISIESHTLAQEFLDKIKEDFPYKAPIPYHKTKVISQIKSQLEGSHEEHHRPIKEMLENIENNKYSEDDIDNILVTTNQVDPQLIKGGAKV